MFEFKSNKFDPSLFVYFKASSIIYIPVYVDDIIKTWNDIPLLHQLISKLNIVFSLKDLGSSDYFLGMKVKHLSDGSIALT